jgi:excinuclease UvrABC helicase subunit UvrB
MNLTKEDAIVCAKAFEDYFGNFSRIDEYMRDQKLNSLMELPSNPLFPLEDDLFQDFTMHPKDMNFEAAIEVRDKLRELKQKWTS